MQGGDGLHIYCVYFRTVHIYLINSYLDEFIMQQNQAMTSDESGAEEMKQSAHQPGPRKRPYVIVDTYRRIQLISLTLESRISVRKAAR